MTDTPANYMTSGGGLGPNLWSTATEQYAVMYSTTNGIIVAKRSRSNMTWVVTTISGNAATALHLPNTDGDSHKYPAICVDGLGIIHVWANMHGGSFASPGVPDDLPFGTLRYIQSINPHDITSWTTSATGATMPGTDIRNTYPMPCQFSDGTIFFYMRVGGTVDPTNNPGISNASNSYMWTRGPSASSWSAQTKLFNGFPPGATTTADDNSNYNAYPTVPFVEGPGSLHPDRLHLAWVWRLSGGAYTVTSTIASSLFTYTAHGLTTDHPVTVTNPGTTTGIANGGTYWPVAINPNNFRLAATQNGTPITLGGSSSSTIGIATIFTGRGINLLPSYASSDDKGATWHAVDGTLLTLPISPVNNLACQTGLTHPTSYSVPAYVNGGGLCVDPAGGIHWALSSNPWFHITWDGGAWSQTPIHDTGTQVLLAGYPIATAMCPYWLNGELWYLAVSVNPYRHRRLLKADGTSSVQLSPELSDPDPAVPFSGDWASYGDAQCYRLNGTFEILSPDGNVPRVFQFGANARMARA